MHAEASQKGPAETPETISDIGPVNMLHVELLCHLYVDTSESLDIRFEGNELSFPDIFQYGLSEPYLVNEVLALAAVHLSVSRPAQEPFYKHHASQLQAHALSNFHTLTPARRPVGSNVSVSLFVSIVAAEALCSTLRREDNYFDCFLDQFRHAVRIQQEIYMAIGGVSHLSRQTALSSLLEPEHVASSLSDRQRRKECLSLLHLVNSSTSLKHSARRICREAIQALHIALCPTSTPAQDIHGNEYFSCSGIIAWPALAGLSFAELLLDKVPEALVIFAHYGALLLAHQGNSWLLGDCGEFIIESIQALVGPDWRASRYLPVRELYSQEGRRPFRLKIDLSRIV